MGKTEISILEMRGQTIFKIKNVIRKHVLRNEKTRVYIQKIKIYDEERQIDVSNNYLGNGSR
jgi:hypothetical protein